MAAESAFEHINVNSTEARPNLYLVPEHMTDNGHQAVVERQTGVERSALGEVLINVVVDVDGQPYDMCINISRGTLGNGQPLSSFFGRFERRHENADGSISGDFGRADTLADHALYLATRR